MERSEMSWVSLAVLMSVWGRALGAGVGELEIKRKETACVEEGGTGLLILCLVAVIPSLFNIAQALLLFFTARHLLPLLSANDDFFKAAMGIARAGLQVAIPFHVLLEIRRSRNFPLLNPSSTNISAQGPPISSEPNPLPTSST